MPTLSCPVPVVAVLVLAGIVVGPLLAWAVRPWVVCSTRPWPMAGFSAADGAVTLAVGCRFATDPVLAAWWWWALCSVALAWIDLSCHRLPRPWVIALAAGGVVMFTIHAITVSSPAALLRSVSAGVLVLAVGSLAYWIAPGGLGYGDITLLAAISIYTGWIGWRTVLVGIAAALLVLGILAGLAWATTLRARTARIAAGPCLILGGWIAVLVHTS
ncbi:leader peptidase (prepilin peptidase) / N-methyltransferase [Saccharopolyspora shandongensis]|uniref:Leader peptidase (Prepilin peptidase) / N-methyltransferase n=1 Tax=Saccharopolyspora shandongensis TaxID=418495 RepID=A0A1H3GD32_9PSEU|nr:leader peptidase (prepilin peptidase) / N-methyltransferase [Saccharopolyspora shandongensis]